MRRPLEERPRGGTRRSGQGRNWLTALAGTVALIAVAAVLVFLLTLAGTGGSEDDLEGRSTVSRACLHAGPDFSANPRLPDGDHCLGPLKGEEVTVECSTTGTLKLSGPGDFGGRFVDADSMEVDGTPPPC